MLYHLKSAFLDFRILID